VQAADLSTLFWLKKVTFCRCGEYINFHLTSPNSPELKLQSINQLKAEYGFVKNRPPKKKINCGNTPTSTPCTPIHIGQQLETPMLADEHVARILKFRGHNGSSHYYIDDVRTPIIRGFRYGYQKLGNPVPTKEI
jgi:arginyl-tRNA synthetase